MNEKKPKPVEKSADKEEKKSAEKKEKTTAEKKASQEAATSKSEENKKAQASKPKAKTQEKPAENLTKRQKKKSSNRKRPHKRSSLISSKTHYKIKMIIKRRSKGATATAKGFQKQQLTTNAPSGNTVIRKEVVTRTVDTRGSYVELDKYNEKYANLADKKILARIIIQESKR